MSLPKDSECIVFDNGSDSFDPKETLSQCGRNIILYRVHHNMGIDGIFMEAINFLKNKNVGWAWFIGDDDFLIEESQFVFSKKWNANIVIVNSIGESQIEKYRDSVGIQKEIEYIAATPKLFFRNFSLRMPFGSVILNVNNIELSNTERWNGTHHLYSGLLWDHLSNSAKDECVFIDTPAFCRGEGQQTWTSYKKEVYERIGIWFGLIPDAFRAEAETVFNRVWLPHNCPSQFRELAMKSYLKQLSK
ncbi:hypothetical protein ABMY26_36055 (plasmid) [Azospirillum sp. HJ39]|uniref:hypothetical protein n=1 Tax=Azospirillum sp. HJ39 TaxID=3159496 RepID=UPI003557D29D